jgi:hypothetical protein
MLGKLIARDFIAIAGEMRRYPASNENTGYMRSFHSFLVNWDGRFVSCLFLYSDMTSFQLVGNLYTNNGLTNHGGLDMYISSC